MCAAQALIEQRHCEQLDALGQTYAAQLGKAASAAAAAQEVRPTAPDPPFASRATHAHARGAGHVRAAAGGAGGLALRVARPDARGRCVLSPRMLLAPRTE